MVKWYYDVTPDQRHSEDAEGCLIALCDRCAAELAADVQHAASPDDDLLCEYCESRYRDSNIWQLNKSLIK